MDLFETLSKLSELEPEKLSEVLLRLRNAVANVPSSDSAGKASGDLKDSLKSSNNSPDKLESKQKTLDSWIVKKKIPYSNSDEMAQCKEIIPIVETGEMSRNLESEGVSSTLQDHQLPCSSSAPTEKSSKPENEVNKKKLRILVNRQDCLESKHKSPDISETPFEKTPSSPIKIKSPIKKQTLISEISDRKSISPEEHSPTPPRSYNLRSARGASDEKSSNEISNSLVISPTRGDVNEIHKSVSKQMPKLKNVGKDASSNSGMCFKEGSSDQKTDLCSDIMSKEIAKSSECKSTVINSESEKTLKIVSTDNNKSITDDNPTPIDLDAALVVKGKRKRGTKDSKKLCTVKTTQKNSPEEMNVTNKSAQSSKNVTKSNSISENPSESLIEKMILLSENDASTSPIHKAIFTNDTVKSVSKLNLKKTMKRKDKIDLMLHDKTKLDSIATEVKKKNLLNPEIDSGITKNVDFQNEKPNEQLKSRSNSKSENKECADKLEEFFIKDANLVTSVNVEPKKVSRKRGHENKSRKTAKNSMLSDSDRSSKINNEDSITSTETSAKNSSPKSKEDAKETDKSLIKDTNTVTLVNLESKKINRKRGNENKSIKAAKNSLSDSEITSKNNNTIQTSSKISPSNNAFDMKTEEVPMKGTNIVPINAISKKKIRKKDSEHKSLVLAKNSLSSDLGQASKNVNEGSISSSETSLIDLSKNSPSQSKESSKGQLIKDTDTETTINVDSKTTGRKRGIRNKSVLTKNILTSNSEQASNYSDKDRISSIEISSKISPSQNNKFAKETEKLFIKDTNHNTPINVSSEKKIRKKVNESLVVANNSLSPDSGQASKNDNEDSIASTETSPIDSSKNLPSQSKKGSKETEELLIKERNTLTLVDSKRTSRKKGIGNNIMVTTKNILTPDSEQTSKNSVEDSVISIKTSSIDSSKNSPSQSNKGSKEIDELLIKDTNTGRGIGNKSMVTTKNILISDLEQASELGISAVETSSINSSKNSKPSITVEQTNSMSNTCAHGKIILQNKCSQSVNLHSQSSDHSTSPNSSNNELNPLNEMKDSLEDRSQKFSISPIVSKSNDGNVLDPQGNSNFSGLSKKLSTLKRKMSVPSNSRKKLKVTKDENQSNTPQSISGNMSSEMENPDLNLKKSGKKHLDVLITKSEASSSTSNLVQEPKDQLLMNLELNKKLTESHKEKDRVTNSKKVKGKLKCGLVGASYVKNKLSKTKKNKKTSIKSANKAELGNSPEKRKENEHTLENQMELDSFHSVEKSDTLSSGSDNSVVAEKAQEIISVDISDDSERVKNIFKEKAGDLAFNNASYTGVAQTNFKSSVEFDEEIRKNYEAFCKVNEMLKAQRTSIEELFENPKMINSLNSFAPVGVYRIMKCSTNSKIIIMNHVFIDNRNEAYFQ